VLRPAVWGLLIPLVALAGLLLYLRGDAAAERARAFLAARLSDALERPVTIGALELDLWPLAIEVRDLVIPGPDPGDRPLVVVPRGQVELSIESLRRPRFTVQRLWLDRPEVYVEIGAAGHTNLPHLAASSGGEPSSVEVKIGTLLIEGGSFTLNERTIPLDLDAQGVLTRLVGTDGGLPLLGRVEVARVMTTLPGGAPYPLSIEGQVKIRETAVELLSGRVQGPDLATRVSGTYTWRGTESRLHLEAEGQGRAELVAALGYDTGGLRGPVRFDTRLNVNGAEWLLDGELTSERLEIAGWETRGLAAHFAGKAEGIDVEVRDARLLGGGAKGRVRVDLTTRPLPVEIDLDVADLNVRTLFANLGVPLRGVSGRAGGTLSYHLSSDAPLDGHGWANLRVRGGQIQAPRDTGVQPAAGQPVSPPRTIALGGEVSLVVDQGILSSEAIRLTSPFQRITVEALAIDLATGRGGFDFSVDSADVGRLGLVLPPPAPGEGPLPWFPTTGQGLLAGHLDFGGEAGLVAELGLDLSAVETPGARADRVRGEMTLTETAVESLRLELDRTLLGEAGALLITGRVPFETASAGEATSATGIGTGIDLTFDAAGWPFAEIRSFVPLELPLEGSITGRLELFGDADTLGGELRASLTPVRLAGVEADRLSVEMTFGPEAVRVREARLALPAGEVSGWGELGLTGAGSLDLYLEAPDLALTAAPFTGLLGQGLSGQLAVRGVFGGTLEDPTAELTLDARELAVGSQILGEAGAEAHWAGGELRASGSLLGLITFAGGGALGSERADLSFAVSSEAVRELAAVALGEGSLPGGLGAGSEATLGGSLAGALTVRGPLGETEVGLTLDVIRLAYGEVHLGALEPARFRLTPTGVAVDSLYLGDHPEGGGGEDASELFLFGEVGLAAGAPLDLRLQASLPARWAEPILPGAHIRGSVDALARIRGTAAAPRIDGQASLSEGEVLLQGFPHALEKIRAVALLYPDRLVLDSFTSQLAGGRVQAAGNARLEDNALGDWRLQANFADLRLRYPEGWVVQGGGDLVLLPVEGGHMIRGAVKLTRASYVRDIELNLFQLLSGFLRRQRLEVGVADPVLTTTQLNVALAAPDAFRVRNNVADLSGSAELTVLGTLARPVIVGQVETAAGGTLVYGETEYRIERGLLTFARLDRIDPVVDLLAISRVREYEITLNLSGDLERMNASFSSEPPLSDLDVLALLSTGERLAGGGDLTSVGPGGATGGTGLGGGGGGAEAFLYGQAASAVSSRVKSLFGLDKFRIDPTTSAGGSVNSARLIVGQQITRDLFVTYQRDVSSNAQDLVEAEWRIRPGLVVVLSVVDGQQYGVDLRWDTRF